MTLMIEHDSRTLDIKIKEGLKSTELRKMVRDNVQFKQAKAPKNKTSTTSIKIVTVRFNDSNFQTPSEIVSNCLMKVFEAIEKDARKGGFNVNFPITQEYLDKNNLTLGANKGRLEDWEEVKIKNLTFYYQVDRIKKEVMVFEMDEKDISVENDDGTYDIIDPEDGYIDDIMRKGKVVSEETDQYNIRIVIPLKRLELNKPKNSRVK